MLAPHEGEDPRAALFELARAAALGGAQWLLAITGQSGALGSVPMHGGAVALLKSVAREWPQLRCRAVDLDPTRAPDELAALILGELLGHDDSVQVIHDSGGRATQRPVEASLEGEAAAPFAKGDVVLITGGGRGITAGAAVAIAERYGCTVELVGRSPLPAAEDPALAACADAPALRRHFLAQLEGATPARVESAVQRALADRQIRATISAIEKTGVAHRYHALDVRDATAFGALIDDIYARHGRLDVVIHGAGVIEDKLLKHKTRESFDRVFETKVAGASVLASKLRPDCRVVFFSSIAGTFGNRGQIDYAAANEALDHLAHHLAASGRRAVSVAWGPWGGTGMVSPELEREYAKRGVGLIPQAAGFERLFDELARGRDAQVILMCATPERLEG
jgi:NAD(P)-dependent dehydrogenase (short-subunit alcohol dehydrogenase family)